MQARKRGGQDVAFPSQPPQDILRSLIRTGGGDLLEQYYTDFRDTHGSRPLALEAYEDGFNPRTVRNEYGSWFDFVATMGDLTPAEAEAHSYIGAFLGQLEITPMTRSYKMLVHLAMLGDDAFPGPLELDRLGRYRHGSARAEPCTLRPTREGVFARRFAGRRDFVLWLPYDWFPRLAAAAPQQRENWELIGKGEGLHMSGACLLHRVYTSVYTERAWSSSWSRPRRMPTSTSTALTSRTRCGYSMGLFSFADPIALANPSGLPSGWLTA